MQRVRASVGEKVRLFNPLRNDEVVSLLDSVRLAGSLQVRLAHPKLGRVEQEVLASVLAAIAPVIVVKRPEGVWLNDVEQLDVCHNSSPEEEVLAEDVGEDQVSALVDASVRKKPQGRPTVVSSDVLRIIQELLDADAQQAHVRRREDVATVGVTVRQMLKRLAECNLKVSESTVRRLFVAPHAGHLSSRSYSSLFRVRMTSYQDTSHEEHPAQHHSRAQVRLVMEAAVKFAEEVAAFSCDAKAVVPVGALAVSKFVQPKKYMLAPHTVSDHQFAVKSHVKPVVLLHLDLEREKRKGLVRGRDNRERYGYPRTGSLTVYLRACMFVQNNAHTNVQHLVDTYEALPAAGQKPVLFVISDNATDYNPSSITVELCLWRAMKKLKLDMLLACSYAPYDSASNPVERAMACLSFSLAGRTFGHDPPPRKDEENHAMHNSALSAMAQALSGTRDQYPITAHPVSLQNGSDDTWDSIKAVAHGSRKATNGNPALLTVLGEFQEMRTHLDRRNNLCAFKRCTSLKCAHCTKLPKRDLALIAKNKLEDMGLSLVTVPGDGNCQFHALGLVLGAQAAAVRSSVVAFAAANPTLLRELVQARDPQAWMNGMATHDWGDIVSLTLATKMHPSLSSLVLFVLSGVSQFVMPVGEEPNENSVMLVYYYHEQNAHYDF
ncbi:hypothetical protein DIPPA_10824, partial [Diplonema papillatum]